MHIGRPIDPILHAPRFGLAHRPRCIGRHRAALGIGHQPARAEDAPQPPDLPHHIGRGYRHVKIRPPAIDPLHEVFRAHEIRARSFGLGGGLALGKNRNAHGFSQAVGQNDRAAHELVRLPGIDAEAKREFDGFVEFPRGHLLQYINRFGQVVMRLPVKKLGRLFVAFGLLPCHTPSGQFSTVRPMLRAVPAIMRLAASTLAALRS